MYNKTTMKKHNFSAGPCILPSSVLEKASKAVINFDNLDLSLLEISHRSDSFQEILKGTKSNLKKLMNIPSNYQILFLQGGATFHNTFVASNVAENKSVSNLVTGTWGQKTYDDFIKIKPTKKRGYGYD